MIKHIMITTIGTVERLRDVLGKNLGGRFNHIVTMTTEGSIRYNIEFTTRTCNRNVVGLTEKELAEYAKEAGWYE